MLHQICSCVAVALMPLFTLSSQQVTYKFTRHYNEKVVEFEARRDIDANTIVMLGDSHTELGKDWSARLGVPSVVNYGIIGDNTEGVIHRLCQITPHHPKAIFLLIGANNVTKHVTAEQVFEGCKAIIDSIRSQTPTTKLYVQSLFPINERFRRWKPLVGQTDKIPQINALLAAYCRDKGVVYIDMFSRLKMGRTNILRKDLTADGLHLSPLGYEVWERELRKYVATEVAER